MFVHESSERTRIPELQRCATGVSDRLDFMQALHHVGFATARGSALLLENRVGTARIASKEHAEVLLKIEQRIVRDPKGCDVHVAISRECHVLQAAICRSILILISLRTT